MPKATARKGSNSTSTPAAAPCATPLADFIQLGYDGRCSKFVQVDSQQRVSFSEMGKLHYLISEDISAWNKANPKKKERTIYGELRKLGVRDKSISNASYSSRMIRELVTPGYITEAQYDELTFQDCLAVARSMSTRSALQLDGQAVGQLMTQKPDDFDRELACIYEHGVTEGERQAQIEKQAADAAKALADAQTAAQKTPAKPATPGAAPATPVAAGPAAIAGAGNPAAEDENASPETDETEDSGNPGSDEEEHSSNSGRDGEQEEHETSTAVAAGKITPMPAAAADPDAMLPAMLDVLAEVGTESEHFTANAQQALIAKIDEVRAVIAGRVQVAEVAA